MHPISPLEAVILGLVQGLTEFIPVSSSAHLNITHWLMGHPKRELTFDVMLHLGTLVALAWYFRHDWKQLLFNKDWAKLRNYVFLACVPAGVFGYLGRKLQDGPPFSLIQVNAIVLGVAGLVLFLADRVGKKARSVEELTLADAVVVGCSQALALLPGVSRSGSTMTAGLFMGLTREAAARFSFLMSLPITLGAFLYEFYSHVIKTQGDMGVSTTGLVLGILASGASGFWAIGFLLNFLRRSSLTPFVIWRIVVAIFILGLFATGLDKHFSQSHSSSASPQSSAASR